MFSLGIPLPPSYVANMARVFAERMRRILLSCEEFQYLPGNCQEAMLKDNVIEATTLCLARMDTLTDSKTQLNFALGK